MFPPLWPCFSILDSRKLHRSVVLTYLLSVKTTSDLWWLYYPRVKAIAFQGVTIIAAIRKNYTQIRLNCNIRPCDRISGPQAGLLSQKVKSWKSAFLHLNLDGLWFYCSTICIIQLLRLANESTLPHLWFIVIQYLKWVRWEIKGCGIVIKIVFKLWVI